MHESEIADDYPLPAQYAVEEDEADELVLFGDEEAFGLDPEHLPRRLLSDFSIYNAEVQPCCREPDLHQGGAAACQGAHCGMRAGLNAALVARGQMRRPLQSMVPGGISLACPSMIMGVTVAAGLQCVAGAAAHVERRGPGCGAVRLWPCAG